jgi:N-acetylglucosaminyldiphosphoundecaprenol N-acetyl-beta-D-mannosaminyltransferase
VNSIEQDFQRDVYCLFGLPVDNLTMAQTRNLLRERAGQKNNFVLTIIISLDRINRI